MTRREPTAVQAIPRKPSEHRRSRPEGHCEHGLRNFNGSNVANRNAVSIAVEGTRNAALIANRATAVVTPVDRAARRKRRTGLRGARIVRERPEKGIRRGLIAEARVRATAVVARDVMPTRHEAESIAVERGCNRVGLETERQDRVLDGDRPCEAEECAPEKRVIAVKRRIEHRRVVFRMDPAASIGEISDQGPRTMKMDKSRPATLRTKRTTRIRPEQRLVVGWRLTPR